MSYKRLSSFEKLAVYLFSLIILLHSEYSFGLSECKSVKLTVLPKSAQYCDTYLSLMGNEWILDVSIFKRINITAYYEPSVSK